MLRYFAAWTPLVLVYAALLGNAPGVTGLMAIIIATRTVGWAAVLGVAVRWFARRLPPGSASRPRWVAVHLLGALLYASAWNLAILAGMRPGFPSWSATFAEARGWLGWQLLYGGVVYALLTAITWKAISDERARREAARRQETEALQVRAELDALRGRLDPHFLFNTLHSLTALARHDPARTESGLMQLAELLRYVFDPRRGARATVRLGDELAFVQSYLALEGLRLGPRLRVEMHVEEDALEAPVPSLLLQPLVENAIKHAIAPRASGGLVRVGARYVEDRLVLSVDDDGAGAGAGETTENPSGAGPSSVPAGTGVALATLRRRLSLTYGADATLETTSSPAGFHATVAVPA